MNRMDRMKMEILFSESILNPAGPVKTLFSALSEPSAGQNPVGIP
jgi:hypothetical protein